VKTLNYAWRVLATGLCFAVFSGGGLVMSHVIIPLSALNSKSEQRQQRTRWLIHKSFRFFVRLMSALGVIAFDIAEAEAALSHSHGKVVIANHPSLIDVVVLISIIPHADCIIKQQLWDNFFMGGVLRSAGYIMNSGDMEVLIKACGKSLNAGYSLIIFPEGTRTTPNQEITLQRGASNIALRCQADLIPVLIRCEPTTLTKNEKWYSVPASKVRFSLRVQEPIRIAAFDAGLESISVKARHLTARLKDHFTTGLRYYG
jgi:1-acyl-sn-glycerol-3-phosphate acyltransferase